MGILSCCAKKEGEAKPKSLKKRNCTDVLCLVIFLAFVGVLGFIFALCLMAGDYTALLYSADYMGNRCGVGTYADRPKAFYPRIPRDMLEQQDIINAGTVSALSNLRLYALCVPTCPTEFDVDNPSVSMVTDYGYDPTSSVTQALGTGTQAVWLSPTPTVDIANRCIPREDSTQTMESMCAFPKCDAPEAVAVGAVCANSTVFTNGEWPICAASTGSGDPGTSSAVCAQQQDVCAVRARYTATMTHELQTNDAASAAMLANVASVVGGVFEIMSSIYAASGMIIVGGVALPVFLAFVYMLLLFLFAKVIIYTLLIMLVLAEMAATFVCLSRSGMSFNGVDAQTLISTAQASVNVTLPSSASAALAAVNEDSQWMYSVAFLILAIVTVITLITVITARRKIAICAGIIKEATTVFTTMPLLMTFPIGSIVVQMGVCAWFIAQMMLINTTQSQSIDLALNLLPDPGSGIVPAAPSIDPIENVRDLVTSPWYQNGCFVITIYGFFVLIQWVQGIAWCTMSGACYYWYYFRNAEGDDASEKTRIPIARSLGRTLSYHCGSVAFAAFVIALCDMLRTISEYIERQMAATGQDSQIVKLAFKVLNCCLHCLKKTVKFVSYYGLVFVSCQGTNFCLSCYRTFFFFLQNPGQVSINATVVFLLKLIAMLSMPLSCAVVFYYILTGSLAASQNAMYPTAIIFILAAVMTQGCMCVFECTITTIFVCCFQDKAEFGGKYMSDRLAKAFQIKRGKGGDKDDGSGVLKTNEAAAKEDEAEMDQVDVKQTL